MENKEDLKVLTHDQAFPLHDAEFKRINARIKELEDLGEKSIEVVSKMEKSLEFVHERLDARQAQTDAILGLGSAVEHMAKQLEKVVSNQEKTTQMAVDHEYRLSDMEKSPIKDDLKEMKTDINTIKDKLVVIENAPAKKLASYIDNGFKAAVTAVMLYLLWMITSGQIGG
jgi:DNA repair exonuclease SbcCD ATPase subunit